MPNVATADCSTGQITTRPMTTAELNQQQSDASMVASRQAADDAFRSQILAIAQSAVGITLANLTTVQIKALFAVILYQRGAVDPATLQVLPLSQWA